MAKDKEKDKKDKNVKKIDKILGKLSKKEGDRILVKMYAEVMQKLANGE